MRECFLEDVRRTSAALGVVGGEVYSSARAVIEDIDYETDAGYGGPVCLYR